MLGLPCRLLHDLPVPLLAVPGWASVPAPSWLAVAILPAADWNSLVSNPPFGQPAPTTTAATGDMEFRGVVQEENSYLINLYTPPPRPPVGSR